MKMGIRAYLLRTVFMTCHFEKLVFALDRNLYGYYIRIMLDAIFTHVH